MMKKGQSSKQKKSASKRSRRVAAKKYRDSHWEQRLWDASSHRGGLDKTVVTKEFLNELWDKQQGLCFWTQVPMVKYSEFHRHPQKVSMDRIDPLKSYIPENIVLSCLFANFGKSSTDIRTWLLFLRVLQDALNPLVCNQLSRDVQRVLQRFPTPPPHPSKMKV